jgi:hypothetical protein
LRVPAILLAVLTVGLAACSGGGAGGGGGGIVPGGGGSATPTPTPAPTATPVSYTASGTLTDSVTSSVISGATVTIGSMPATSCSGWAGCGMPVAPTHVATTAPDGTFSITGLASGTYFLTISVDASPTATQTHTILHRSIAISSANLALGTVHISALSADEKGWLHQLNIDRGSVSFPTTSPVVADEYDTVASRADSAGIQSGAYPYGDPTEAVFASQAASQPGAFTSISTVADDRVGAGDWAGAETDFYNEKPNCADWRTCTFVGSGVGKNGHYIILSQDSAVWFGLAESSAPALAGSGITGLYVYTGIITDFGATTRTASSGHKRPAVISIHH